MRIVGRAQLAVEPAFGTGPDSHLLWIADDVEVDGCAADEGTGDAVDGPGEVNRVGESRHRLVPQAGDVAPRSLSAMSPSGGNKAGGFDTHP